MKLEEALKSGKPYKRKIDDRWMKPGDSPIFYESCVLADDWEVPPDPPREVWFNLYPDGDLIGPYPSKIKAEQACGIRAITKCFREVMES